MATTSMALPTGPVVLAQWVGEVVFSSWVSKGKGLPSFCTPRYSPGLGRCAQCSESSGSPASQRCLPRAEPCGRGRRIETASGDKHTNKPTNKGCACYRERKGPFSSGPRAPRTSSRPGDRQLSRSSWGLASPKPPVTLAAARGLGG